MYQRTLSIWNCCPNIEVVDTQAQSYASDGFVKATKVKFTTHVNECGQSTDVSTDLRQTLFAYGLRLQPVKGDGNCFFTYNMLSDLRVWVCL